MKRMILFVLILMAVGASAQKKHICLTFDDLPVAAYGNYDTLSRRHTVDKLVEVLKRNRVPAIGFVNEQKLLTSEGQRMPSEISLLRTWIDSGLALGNHTFSHPDYNTTSFAAYTRDILKGEPVSNGLLKQKKLRMRYFRHPFLHVGVTKSRADSLSAFLSAHGYTVAPVTIDDEDYVFAYAYFKAVNSGDKKLAERIGRDYLAYMRQIVTYFEGQSVKMFGRDISQIILLHASMLNSDYTGELIAMLKEKGYDFIPIETALKDKAYKTAVTVYGTWGISWLDRWALSQGRKGDFFAGEPEVPGYVRKALE
jgi:peptidoglycan/xylan/chitin deacetylase (PgdA/CDA1 family)